MRRLLTFALLLLGSTSASPGPAEAAGGYVVVVNKANALERIKRAELSKLFLTRTPLWPDGSAAVPYDLGSSAAARKAFTQSVHGKALWMVVAYWQQEVASGRSRPPAVTDELAALQAVRDDPRAVAYVAEGLSLGAGVKTLAVDP